MKWSFCLALTLTLQTIAGAGAAAAVECRGQRASASGISTQVQASHGGWNSPRVRELVQRAITRRASWTDDSLFDYRAHASGHIYFLFDLGRGTQRSLVKADQLALNLFWSAPDRTHQVIVGRREEKVLPTGIEYHLDHLTVVMDNFGERISMGEGSEVQDALHPAARGALDYYDYRLTDSLTLVLTDREVRVNKIEVRPRDPTGPGIVGAIYLDRSSAGIVRMEFTFTAASYLDPQLDYINVRLENGLWNGRYWLPFRQGLELRRELRVLDFPAGGIIRAEFKIGDYRFNKGLPDELFHGARVTHLPARARVSYEFDDGLYAALDPAVAVAPPSLEQIRQAATRIVGRSYLQKAHDLRLAVPGVSSVARLRRAEGLYVGPGFSRDFSAGFGLLLLGGFAIGPDRFRLSGLLTAPLGELFELEIAGELNEATDVAPWPASSGAVATLAAAVDGEDYRDQYWTSGGTVGLARRWDRTRARLSVAWERWESADLSADQIIDRSYRAVRTVDEGDVLSLALDAERLPESVLERVGGGTWGGRVEGATRDLGSDFDYVRASVRAAKFWPTRLWDIRVLVSAEGGALLGGRAPAQRLFAVGGRGTVRGYSFHSFVGDLYGSAAAEASRDMWYPFVTFAVFADLAWIGVEVDSNRRAVDVWNQQGDPAGPSRGPLVGVGGGVGLFFDILRVELARGLESRGIWELVIRARTRFWSWL